MADLKTRSIRAEESTLDKFKQIAEGFDNQGAALESLINAYELQTAKAVITTRQTDISDYDAHLQAIQSAFLHSLEIAENAEERVRLEFQQALLSKDKTVVSLQERLEQSEHLSAELNARVAELESAFRQSDNKLNAAEKAQASSEAALLDKQRIIDSLTQQLAEATTSRERADKAIASEEKARTALQTAEARIKELEQAAQVTAERAENAKEKAVLEAERAAAKEQKNLIDTIMKQSETINDLKAQLSTTTTTTKKKKAEPTG